LDAERWVISRTRRGIICDSKSCEFIRGNVDDNEVDFVASELIGRTTPKAFFMQRLDETCTVL